MAMLCFIFCINFFSTVFIFYFLLSFVVHGFGSICWREKEGDVQ
jgi:hypothetical protein